MSGRSRRRAFLAAALAVASGAALLPLLSSPPDRGHADAAAEPAIEATGALGTGTARGRDRVRQPEPRNPPGAEAPRREARARARRFLAGFLRYQDGHADARTRRALAATATPHLGRQLLRAAPRAGRGDRARGRVVRLAIYGPWEGEVKASAALAYRHGRALGLFEFSLRRQRGGWRVVELYPEGS